MLPEVKNSRTEFEVTQLIGEDADRGRPLRHLDRHDVLENICRQHDVHGLAGDVDHAAPHGPQHEVEHDGNAHADGQCNERWNGAVGNDPVVHAHGEQGHRQRKYVDQEGRQRDVPVTAPVDLDHRPEPMVARQISGSNGTRVSLGCCPHQEGVAGIVGAQRLDAQDLRGAILNCRVEYLDALIIRIDPEEDQCRTVPHDQDGWKNDRGDVGNVPLDGLGLQSGPPGSPVVQGHRELSVEDRKAAQQSVPAHGAAVMGSQISQGSGEGVGSWRAEIDRSTDPVWLVVDRAVFSLFGGPREQSKCL